MMLYFEKEEDMPLDEVKMVEGKDMVHHLSCNGSRRHVIWWDSNGQHCDVKECEINYK